MVLEEIKGASGDAREGEKMNEELKTNSSVDPVIAELASLEAWIR